MAASRNFRGDPLSYRTTLLARPAPDIRSRNQATEDANRSGESAGPVWSERHARTIDHALIILTLKPISYSLQALICKTVSLYLIGLPITRLISELWPQGLACNSANHRSAASLMLVGDTSLKDAELCNLTEL